MTLRVPPGRQDARLRVSKIGLAIHEAVADILGELENVTYAELLLAMNQVQQGYTEKLFMSETPRDDDVSMLTEERAKKIFDAGVDSTSVIDTDDGKDIYGPSFEDWWEDQGG